MQPPYSLQNPTPSYEDFLKWCQTNQNSGSMAFVAHTSNSSICFSRSSPLGPWVLDSGASDHVTGNKGLFSSLSTAGYLPSITVANGSQTRSQGIGTAQILLSLSVTSVLYVPTCLFILLSVSPHIFFLISINTTLFKLKIISSILNPYHACTRNFP